MDWTVISPFNSAEKITIDQIELVGLMLAKEFSSKASGIN